MSNPNRQEWFCCPNRLGSSQGFALALRILVPKICLGTGMTAMALLWLLNSATNVQAQSSVGAIEKVPQLAGDRVAQASPTTQISVNPNSGNDSTGDGSDRAPFKSLTRALSQAVPNSVILLAPGTYNETTGETFPIALKPGVIVQGDKTSRGQRIVIVGGGFFRSPTFATQNITILGADSAQISGVTVTNPNDRGYGLWIESSSPVVTDNTFTGNTHDGISITGSSAPVVRGNSFSQNGANGITIYGTSQPQIKDNVFENTGYGINIAQNAAPTIEGNRLFRNRTGVVVQGNGRPVLRNNQIEANRQDGVVAIAQAQPDLGTASQPGGNAIRNNGQLDINAKASNQIIPAYGNQMSNRTAGRLDLAGKTIPSAPPPLAVRPSPPPSVPDVANRQPIAPAPNVTNRQPTPIAVSPPRQPVNPPRSPSSVNASNYPRLVIPTDNRPVQIPVPPPPSSVQSPPPPSNPAVVAIPVPPSPNSNQPSALPVLTTPSPSPGVLPVPGPNIPGNSSASPVGAGSLRYRVIVEAASDRDQDRVRRVAPEAFRTVLNGRVVMQAGVFSDRVNAEELLQQLESNGLRASVEEL